jgi:hypothetical protein
MFLERRIACNVRIARAATDENMITFPADRGHHEKEIVHVKQLLTASKRISP